MTELAAVCSHCLTHREEIASEVLTRLCEGKRRRCRLIRAVFSVRTAKHWR